MIELDVVGVRIEKNTNTPMLLLRDPDTGRCLPIWIGAAEASAIVNALEGVIPSRPLTHDLMAELLSTLGHTELSGHITSTLDGVFHAELTVDGQTIEARPSDVVALSLRCGFKVTCSGELMAQVGVEMFEQNEDEVKRFRSFLDTVSPDDFEQ
ncbi:hypothetical protein HMPREF1531_02165 [Propionibacterium sp. oral taxon 192 str. F0372]|uniref:bifunctional nuclease family protein n=1 Tax=Propionibacterium sp. oral taxon 192 TaxID=671222 RepID=UPI0003540358|nr:bifunctional nuclease family protein [Propionibacterium sp. oral taxon 192]EPH02853.1 hypothetical protein HMPREF1531_02165 [Propionibacterium sp. oral taxon 192 str. F0372]